MAQVRNVTHNGHSAESTGDVATMPSAMSEKPARVEVLTAVRRRRLASADPRL